MSWIVWAAALAWREWPRLKALLGDRDTMPCPLCENGVLVLPRASATEAHR